MQFGFDGTTASRQLPGVPRLSHLDAKGAARMVDVSDKPVVLREALAAGEIKLQPATVGLIESNAIAKGNVLATARIAGIQAAKRTAELIPMCHPLAISHCDVTFDIPRSRNRIVVRSRVKVSGQTGVEMEALTAVSVAALTIYDMCKSVDKCMVLNGIRLLDKTKRPLGEGPVEGSMKTPRRKK